MTDRDEMRGRAFEENCETVKEVEVGMCGSFGPFDIWGKLTHIEKDADFPFWRDNEVGYDSFTPGPAPLVDENGRLIEEK